MDNNRVFDIPIKGYSKQELIFKIIKNFITNNKSEIVIWSAKNAKCVAFQGRKMIVTKDE